MSRPQAYAPEQGYKWQRLGRAGVRTWEHCEYAKDAAEKRYLLEQYRLAYGTGWEFRTILLPARYWKGKD
jgi:hypothetical protein